MADGRPLSGRTSGDPPLGLRGGTQRPLLLAIEAATPVCSVALLRGDALLDEERAAPGPTAETLLVAVDTLLGRAGVRAEALEAFAVSRGPGSFTSLRVAIATVKGLAFGMDLPVAAVPTLEALARAAPPEAIASETTVVAMLDARRGELFAAAYGPRAGELRPVLAEGVYTPAELVERLPATCVVVGEGAALCGELLRAQLGAGVQLVPPPEGDPAARHVGAVGAALLARGDVVEAATLVPSYVRRAEAEVKRTGERFESV